MLELLYSDDSIAVILKPAGMLSVPGRGPEKQDSAASRIRLMFPDCIEQPSVHRLDMDTSGLMVFALTASAQRHLSVQFQESAVRKKYTAVLDGMIDKRLGKSGRIELRFRLDPDNRPYQIYDPVRGKTGITLWRTAGTENGKTRIEYEPLTGRTHQLRLHSAYPVIITGDVNTGGLGLPIAGDRLYGEGSDELHAKGMRMLLHASEIEFAHPADKTMMSFKNPAPF